MPGGMKSEQGHADNRRRDIRDRDSFRLDDIRSHNVGAL